MNHTKSFVNGQPIYRIEIQGRSTYAIRFSALAQDYDEAAKIAEKLGFDESHSPSFGGGFVMNGRTVPEIIEAIKNVTSHVDKNKPSLLVGSPESLLAAETRMKEECEKWLSNFISMGRESAIHQSLLASSARKQTGFFHDQLTRIRDILINELYDGKLPFRSEEFLIMDKLKGDTSASGLAALNNPY